jgi:hypothetical protein
MKPILARITDSAYRLAVDIGLGKFLEMFEERFGRAATTALLAIIGLGLTGFMLSLIWEHIIVPLYSFAGIIIGDVHPTVSFGAIFTLDTFYRVILTIVQLISIAIISICLITVTVLVMREFVFEYWKEVFLQRSITRAIKERKKKQKSNEPSGLSGT